MLNENCFGDVMEESTCVSLEGKEQGNRAEEEEEVERPGQSDVMRGT